MSVITFGEPRTRGASERIDNFIQYLRTRITTTVVKDAFLQFNEINDVSVGNDAGDATDKDILSGYGFDNDTINISIMADVTKESMVFLGLEFDNTGEWAVQIKIIEYASRFDTANINWYGVCNSFIEQVKEVLEQRYQ